MLDWNKIVTFKVNEKYKTIDLVFKDIPTGPDKVLWEIIESSNLSGQASKDITEQIINILSQHYTSCSNTQELVDTLTYQYSVIQDKDK